MNVDLTDEQKTTQRLARDFAQNEVKRVAEELEKEKRFPYEIVAKLGELGLMGVPYPEEYGGGGGDTLSYALVIEELARFPMLPTLSVRSRRPAWPSLTSRCYVPFRKADVPATSA